MAGKAEEPAIGIDLGTTYSCVGVWQHRQVQIIVNGQGNGTTPSCVAFTAVGRLVGDAAKNQCHSNLTNTIFGAKRLIGRKFQDELVQRVWPFKVVAGTDDKPIIVVKNKGEEKYIVPEEVSSMVLAYMREIAEKYLEKKVTNAVVTVPAYFNDMQRRATVDAGRIAGLNVMRVINESTAAAIAYSLDKPSINSKINVLVFDLGGGTLDVSILEIEDGILEVKAVTGDVDLGGEDFDSFMVDYFVKEFGRKHKMDMSSNPRALRRLWTACERAKRILSFETETTIDIECLHEGVDFISQITRAKFEELNMDLFDKCVDIVDRCLKDAKLEKHNVDEVVLVGGSSRIPRVQQLLREHFDGKKFSKSINPDEAVAYGAAIQAAKLAGNGDFHMSNLVLRDVTPISLGIEVVGGIMSVIVPRNTRVPVVREMLFYCSRDNQIQLSIEVYEGERSLVVDNNLLGKFILEGIPPAPAGVSKVDVSFKIDENGILTVSAMARGTTRHKEITITDMKGRLSATQTQKMIDEAERYRFEDEARTKKAVAKCRLENFLYNVKRRTIGGSFALGPLDSRKLDLAIQGTASWLEKKGETADTDELIAKKVRLENTWLDVSTKR